MKIETSFLAAAFVLSLTLKSTIGQTCEMQTWPDHKIPDTATRSVYGSPSSSVACHLECLGDSSCGISEWRSGLCMYSGIGVTPVAFVGNTASLKVCTSDATTTSETTTTQDEITTAAGGTTEKNEITTTAGGTTKNNDATPLSFQWTTQNAPNIVPVFQLVSFALVLTVSLSLIQRQ